MTPQKVFTPPSKASPFLTQASGLSQAFHLLGKFTWLVEAGQGCVPASGANFWPHHCKKSPLARACYLNHSGGRDEEDHGSKLQSQPKQIVHETLSRKKKKNHKKGLVEWLKV
jgi:hypothetical protein